MANLPHLLLAAGASARMGQPKQLLHWGGVTLIEYQIKLRLQTQQDVFVVLGAHSEEILTVIRKLPVTVLINKKWAEGIGGSIAYGIRTLIEKEPGPDGVLISLLDQPLVPISHLEKMLVLFNPGNGQIIASGSSSGWSGVPVLFDKLYFKELEKLTGDEGARKIIQQHPGVVEYIDCGSLLEDIDTHEAYQDLLKRFTPISD